MVGNLYVYLIFLILTAKVIDTIIVDIGSVPTKDIQTPRVHIVLIPLSWKMRNVLNRMKNQFSDFYFLSNLENSSKIGVIWVKKNRKNLQFEFS